MTLVFTEFVPLVLGGRTRAFLIDPARLLHPGEYSLANKQARLISPSGIPSLQPGRNASRIVTAFAAPQHDRPLPCSTVRPTTSTTFCVPPEAEGLRLDQCLARYVPSLSRRTARVALSIGAVFVDRKRVKVASRSVRRGQQITVHLKGAFERALAQSAPHAAAPSLKLEAPRILHEDEELVVLDKPAGMLAAPTPESDLNNVQAWLQQRAPSRTRVYVVHRLDLQTSGVMVYAKTERANRHLSELFRLHDLRRCYAVFAEGQVSWKEQLVELPLHGRRAVTRFQREARLPRFTRLRAELETGRTHQIRLHLLALGHPVLADARYSKRRPWHPPRVALHATLLEFRHLDGRSRHFETPLPDDLETWYQAQLQSTSAMPGDRDP